VKIFSSLWLGSAWWSREQGCLPLSSGFLIKTHYSPHTKSSLSNDLSGSQIVSLTRLLSYFVVCGPLHITKYTELLHRQTGKSLFYHFCYRIVISAVLVCYIFSSIKFCKLSTHFKSKSNPKSVFVLRVENLQIRPNVEFLGLSYPHTHPMIGATCGLREQICGLLLRVTHISAWSIPNAVSGKNRWQTANLTKFWIRAPPLTT